VPAAAVDVDPEPIFIRDGRLWTSARVTSGMDLTLALVAEDHGEKLARQAAQWLVLYLQRPGGQAQFSALAPAPRLGGRGLGGLRAVLGWVRAPRQPSAARSGT
jgi:transcriptional regulator GlxA family with amidase domain